MIKITKEEFFIKLKALQEDYKVNEIYDLALKVDFLQNLYCSGCDAITPHNDKECIICGNKNKFDDIKNKELFKMEKNKEIDFLKESLKTHKILITKEIKLLFDSDSIKDVYILAKDINKTLNKVKSIKQALILAD